jgi:hypothetical protein
VSHEADSIRSYTNLKETRRFVKVFRIARCVPAASAGLAGDVGRRSRRETAIGPGGSTGAFSIVSHFTIAVESTVAGFWKSGRAARRKRAPRSWNYVLH